MIIFIKLYTYKYMKANYSSYSKYDQVLYACSSCTAKL